MPARLPIGFSNFAQIRHEGLYYVDKTALVADVVRSTRQVVLLPRPRRFGKTLNQTMLRAWFERGTEDLRPLFDGLAVAEAGADVASHQQRHPVIYLTFKDVKHSTWEDGQASLASVLGAEVGRHRPTLEHAPLLPEVRTVLDQIASRTAPKTDLHQTLMLLSQALATATGEPVVILIDEYDTPIHAGFIHGYYDAVVEFFRNLLSAGFKDNPHLYRGVITGILRVAKESIFSVLNNVDVHTVLSPQFTTHFGFTEAEVAALAQACDQPELVHVLRDWYDGYRVGAARIYNPWSVLSQLVRPGSPPQAWWVNTASDEILRELLVGAGLGVQDDLAALIRGEAIARPISEEIVLREVRRDTDALWSFLLFSGYLTADAPLSRDVYGQMDSALRIPNREVTTVYRSVFQGWLRRSLSAGSDAPQRLANALLQGDGPTFEALLERLVMDTLSTHDTAGRRPEVAYQAFLVGLLVQLEATHDVRSNRESGFGRYHVMVRPRQPGRPGAVLELKVIDTRRDETAALALDRAMAQIQDRHYAAELVAAGADPVWCWGAVFDGKRVWVRVNSD